LTYWLHFINIKDEAPRGFLKTMKFSNIPVKINNFFKEVKAEMKKVNWPTQKETFRYTLIVIGASIVVAIFLGSIDFLFTAFLNRFII
jgi:preprotein translocase subunit SecE